MACCFLHRIVARAKVLPYTNVVRWVVEKNPVTNGTFCATGGSIFGSFQPDDLTKMYHLPKPKKQYKKVFLEAFAKEKESESASIK